MIYPLLQSWYHIASGQSTSKSSSQPSFPLSDEPQLRPHPRRHPLFETNNTAWASDEAIVNTEDGDGEQSRGRKGTGSGESVGSGDS